MFACVFVYVGVRGWVPIAAAPAVVCGRAQPSQPQSWQGPLPGRIAGLSRLPLQLSGPLKSGLGNLSEGSRNTCGLYDGSPTATITQTQINADTLLSWCKADYIKFMWADLSPCIICLGQTYNNVLKYTQSSHSSSVSSCLLVAHGLHYISTWDKQVVTSIVTLFTLG